MTSTNQPLHNPYVGPRPFRRGETLYGRGQEVMDLLHLLIAERIVLLYSPSGAGKTSLIQAALVPRLEKKRFEVLPTMRVSLAPSPDIHLPPDTNRYVLSLLLSLQRGGKTEQPIDSKQVQELAGMTLADWLDRRMEGISDERNMVLIFDQFEEILTLEPINLEAKREFFVQVGDALDDRRRWAIFAMREDYVAGLDPYLRQVPTRLSTTCRLELLNKASAKEAMQGPAKGKGVTFADEAATRLVDDLCQIRVAQRDGTVAQRPGLYVEPVQLQVVCRRLWDEKFPPAEETLPEGALIEEGDVEELGDVDTALAQFYEQAIARVLQDPQIDVSEPELRDWFNHQLITEDGTRGTAYQGEEKTGGLANEAIRVLEGQFLIRAETRAGGRWYELVHDRFIEPILEANRVWQLQSPVRAQFQAVLGLLRNLEAGQEVALFVDKKRPQVTVSERLGWFGWQALTVGILNTIFIAPEVLDLTPVQAAPLYAHEFGHLFFGKDRPVECTIDSIEQEYAAESLAARVWVEMNPGSERYKWILDQPVEVAYQAIRQWGPYWAALPEKQPRWYQVGQYWWSAIKHVPKILTIARGVR